MANPVSDLVKNLADKYKAGNAETEGLGKELAARAKMTSAASDSLAPMPDKSDGKSTGTEPSRAQGPYGTRGKEKRIDTKDMVKPLGSFKEGGTVPKTGAYILHKDEKVVPKEKAGDKMATPYDMITGGKKAPKTIQKHEYSKTHNGKHVVTHKHHSADHKDETHMFDKFSEAADHMDANPPQPEQEMAPAGPAAGAAPAGAMPPAGM